MTSPASAHRRMTALEWGMVVTLSFLWGGSFFFNGMAVRELPTLTVVVVRVALAAAILSIALRLMSVAMPRDPAVWRAFFGMALLNNVVPFTLIVWGQAHIASGLASILNATTPVFGVLVAHRLTTDEKMTGGRLAGVLICLAGVAILIGGDALSSLGIDVLAQAACLTAALSYALAGIYGRRFKAMQVSPLATATGQLLASSALLLPMVLLIDRPWALPVPSVTAILALIGVALLSTALAYIIYFRILATAGATNLLLTTFLIPISAILLGTAFLGETLQLTHIGGMVMIGLGLAAIDGRPWLYLRRGGMARQAAASSD